MCVCMYVSVCLCMCDRGYVLVNACALEVGHTDVIMDYY